LLAGRVQNTTEIPSRFTFAPLAELLKIVSLDSEFEEDV
jgi:hypothetical protein